MSYTLNLQIINILIKKDWYLLRKLIGLYLAGALLALSFISLGEWQFVMGTTLLFSMVIGLGNHQLTNTIINERKDHTLPFIMSLPISPYDYVVAKLIANMTLFIIPWSLVVIATIAVFLWTPVPDGVLPLTVICAIYFLLCYCLTWAAGMISESEGVTLFVMVFTNCLIGPMLYIIGRVQGVAQHVWSPEPHWSATAVGIIAVQLLLILFALLSAFVWQARRDTFL
jgi:ABC-2 type transport system permease protein